MMKERLLVLTPRFPYPTIGGDRIRIIHICKALSSKYELTLLSLCESQAEMEYEPVDGLFSGINRVYLPRWKSYLNTARAIASTRPLQLAYYDSPEFRRKIHELIPFHDAVLAHLIRVGQYIEDSPVQKILEMTDAISMNYLRMRKLRGNYSWKKLVYLMEQNRLKAYEQTTVQKFNRVWLTSRTDRDFLDPSHSAAIDVIPNGVDLKMLPYRQPASGGRVIVFIGNMTSLQNQDACHYFIRNILPGVRAHADVVFRIVGSAPNPVRRQFRKYLGVEMTGRIDHIQDGVEGAFCGVCPVRAAAGIQNKILEYLALGLPCVTSAVAFGGVEANPGNELLVYHDPEEAIQQIVVLYSDYEFRTKMAIAGHKLVRENYDWRGVYKKVIDSWVQENTGNRESSEVSL